METQQKQAHVAHDFAPSWLKVKVQGAPGSQSSSFLGANGSALDGHLSLRPQSFLGGARVNGNTNGGVDLLSGNEPFPSLFGEPTAHFNPSLKQVASLSSGGRTHSLEEDEEYHNSLASNGRPPLANGNQQASSIAAGNRRSYVRPKLELRDQRRPHSRHDFRELANFQQHSKPASNISGMGFYGEKNGDLISDLEHLENGHQPTINENGSLKGNTKKGAIGSNTFNMDFPSLADVSSETSPPNGANGVVTNNTSVGGSSNNKTVWDSNSKSKVLSTLPASKSKITLLRQMKSNETANQESAEISNGSSAPSYRSSTSAFPKKKLSTGSRDAPFGLNLGLNHHAKVLPPTLFSTKGGSNNSSGMEILAKNIKTRSNKNEFLRTLRTDSTGSKEDFEMSDSPVFREAPSEKIALVSVTAPPPISNGLKKTEVIEKRVEAGPTLSEMIANLKVEEHRNFMGRDSRSEAEVVDSILSSSLEAEQRLLKEMGWKEDEGENVAPLTDDEVREFKDRINARHGVRVRGPMPSQTQLISHYPSVPITNSNFMAHLSQPLMTGAVEVTSPWSPRKSLPSSVSSPTHLAEDDESSSSSEDEM